MLKDLNKSINIMRRKTGDKKKNQMEILEVKNTSCVFKTNRMS